MNHAMLLDCTLRDGAYLIDKKFGDTTIHGIVRGLLNTGIDVIEIGFLQNDGFGEGKTVFKNSIDAEKFVPALDIATGKTEGTGRLQSIYDYDALLESASVMNYTRWNLSNNLLVKEAGYTQDEQMKYLEKFINGRIKFLNSNLTLDGLKEEYISYLYDDLEYFNKYYSQDIPEEKTAIEEITAIIEQAKIDISTKLIVSCVLRLQFRIIIARRRNI